MCVPFYGGAVETESTVLTTLIKEQILDGSARSNDLLLAYTITALIPFKELLLFSLVQDTWHETHGTRHLARDTWHETYHTN